MSNDQQREVEVKLAVADREGILARIRQLGFEEIAPRSLEVNVLYDTPGGEMRARGELIRIRRVGGRSVMTYKGPCTVARHKEREEIEVDLSSFERMETIVQRLGLVPKFRYEKYRSEWQQPGEPGIIMVDEIPCGDYLELEGPGEWIDRTATLLGFHLNDYINLSYARLYEAHCQAAGKPTGDMVFTP